MKRLISDWYRSFFIYLYKKIFIKIQLKVKDFKNTVSLFYSSFESKKFDDYLRKFNIDKNTRIKNLSKGQSIKLMLAKALSHNAKLLILDEPTSGLDPIFRKDLIHIFQEELENGDKSIIISTHITQDLSAAADYITLINNGQLIFIENKDVINEKYKIIKGSKEEIDSFNNEIINRKDSPYYSEALILDKWRYFWAI